jgi:hypothetical protein
MTKNCKVHRKKSLYKDGITFTLRIDACSRSDDKKSDDDIFGTHYWIIECYNAVLQKNKFVTLIWLQSSRPQSRLLPLSQVIQVRSHVRKVRRVTGRAVSPRNVQIRSSLIWSDLWCTIALMSDHPINWSDILLPSGFAAIGIPCQTRS